MAGLKFADDDLHFIKEQIRKTIKPLPNLTYETIPISKKRSVLVIEVPEGKQKPYQAINPDDHSSKIFYRVGDECIKASRELRNILKQTSRKQGQTIVYSDLEASILKEIDQAGKLTKSEIQKKTKFNSRKVSDCLIRLVTSNVLKIEPANTGDMFQYNQPGSID
jgi:predicted HTH transcriptional regulator